MKLLFGASAVAVSTVLVGCKSDSTACADYLSDALDITGNADCLACVGDDLVVTDCTTATTATEAWEACGASGDYWDDLKATYEAACATSTDCADVTEEEWTDADTFADSTCGTCLTGEDIDLTTSADDCTTATAWIDAATSCGASGDYWEDSGKPDLESLCSTADTTSCADVYMDATGMTEDCGSCAFDSAGYTGDATAVITELGTITDCDTMEAVFEGFETCGATADDDTYGYVTLKTTWYGSLSCTLGTECDGFSGDTATADCTTCVLSESGISTVSSCADATAFLDAYETCGADGDDWTTYRTDAETAYNTAYSDCFTV